jgi:RNA polymerase sigma-70 factor (ECF subfamily)
MTERDDEAQMTAMMQAYQAGDLAAYQALYQKCAGRVYGYLKPRLKRPEEREEVFQQIFFKLHRTRARYSSEYSFYQWLFVISKSVLFDYLRKKGRESNDLATEGAEEIEKIAAPESSPADVHPDLEVEKTLGALSSEQKQIVNWRVMDELSYEEIAAKLNRSEMSVRQILSRSLKKLRRISYGY